MDILKTVREPNKYASNFFRHLKNSSIYQLFVWELYADRLRLSGQCLWNYGRTVPAPFGHGNFTKSSSGAPIDYYKIHP